MVCVTSVCFVVSIPQAPMSDPQKRKKRSRHPRGTPAAAWSAQEYVIAVTTWRLSGWRHCQLATNGSEEVLPISCFRKADEGGYVIRSVDGEALFLTAFDELIDLTL